jgi:hypothetical protein
MAAVTPFAQLVGTCSIYVAAASTAEPAVNATPGGSWTLVGATTGDQTVSKDAAATLFYDNDHQGPVKGVVPQEDPMVAFTLADITHNHLARILSTIANITTAAGPPAVSRVPMKSGAIPTEYALLVKGAADSPFGNFPAQWYFPRGFFEKALELVRGKASRAELAVEFKILEDDTQSENNKLGWTTAQTS